MEILVVEREHLLLRQVQPGMATKAIFGQWRPVPAGTTEQIPGCHLERLRSLCWTLLSLSSLGILQPPRLVSSQKVWLGATASGNDSLGNNTVGQGGEGWDPHCPHLYGKLVLMASVAMLALRPWKLTRHRVVLAHVLHLPAGAASSEDLLSWGWAMENYAREQRRFNKKAGFSQGLDFPEGLLQAGFALPFLQVLVPWVGKGGKAQGHAALQSCLRGLYCDGNP